MADRTLWISYEDLEALVQEAAQAASDSRLDPAEAGVTDDLVEAWLAWEEALTGALRAHLTTADVRIGVEFDGGVQGLVEDMLDSDRGDGSQAVYRALLSDDGSAVLAEGGWAAYEEAVDGLDLDGLVAGLTAALRHLVADDGTLVEAVRVSAWATGADAEDFARMTDA